jgi:osmotically-inducible protein OsmY
MTKPAISSFLAIPLLVLGIEVAIAQTGPADPSAANSMDRAVPTDNTESNRQDPTNRDQTADKQLNDSTDLDFTRRIRRDVTADKNLSAYGHNVKIVSANGTVTLNGVVRTDAEKAEIGMKAASVVGKEHVVNEIKVTPVK